MDLKMFTNKLSKLNNRLKSAKKLADEFSTELCLEAFTELDELANKVEQMLKDAKKKMKEKKDETSKTDI